MVTRLTISFTPEERAALQEMAETDFRPPKAQIRFLLRQEAQRRGLLPLPKSGGREQEGAGGVNDATG